MAGYFGFEIVLDVGVNWLGQIGWGKPMCLPKPRRFWVDFTGHG